MIPRIKSIQQRVVMRNNLIEHKRSGIRRHVSVCDQRHVVPKANRSAYCGIDAVFSHAASDNQPVDLS
jgi:hypothetical protein